MQCQQTTLDLGAKLAGEKRDRDQDFDQVSLSSLSLSSLRLVILQVNLSSLSLVI